MELCPSPERGAKKSVRSRQRSAPRSVAETKFVDFYIRYEKVYFLHALSVCVCVCVCVVSHKISQQPLLFLCESDE